MSWNTSFLAQRTKSGMGKAHYFAGLGLPGAKEVGKATFEDASSATAEGKALAVIGDWTVVIDPFMFMDVPNDPSVPQSSLLPIVVESRLLPSTDRWPAYVFVTFGSSGTYGFSEYEGGKRRRLILRQEGATMFDEGEPKFAGDSWHEGHDEEQLVLALLSEVTGISFETLHSTEFTIFEFDASHLQFVHGD